MTPDVLAHLSALASDKREGLTPKTCSLCRWAMESNDPEVKALVAKVSAPTSKGKPRGGRTPAPYVPHRPPSKGQESTQPELATVGSLG